MANIAAPTIDFDGSSGQPTSQAALLTSAGIAPPAVIVYTGGIQVAPSAAQLAPDPAVGYATSG